MMKVAKIDRGQRPKSGPAPRVSLPRFERTRLENGMTILAIRQNDLPQVSARVVLPHGASDDVRGRAGTALMVARALTEGTLERSALDVAEQLDSLGVRFNVEVKHDATVLNPHFLSRVRDETFELLAEILTRPAFEEKEVSRLRDERLDEIASGLDEPRTVAGLRLNQISFGKHPYGMRIGGEEETVREIEPSGLAEFHARYYRPSVATLILVGELPAAKELSEKLESAFGDWAGDASEAKTPPDPADSEARRVWAVNWPGPQSEIRIGGVGISRLDPDYPAVMVMNAILGGLFSSRINLNLREDKGWTYGASSRFDPRKARGPFLAATAVESKATVGAVREILREMERMQSDPPSDEELEMAKNSLTLSLPRLFETVGQVSSRVSQQVIYGLPDDYWETYTDEARAVTHEQVMRAAEAHLAPKRAAIVVVGPVEEFQDELESLGPVELRDVRGAPLEARPSI